MSDETFNRTIVELKLVLPSSALTPWQTTFNRTIVELKLNSLRCLKTLPVTFNRTIVELKHIPSYSFVATFASL